MIPFGGWSRYPLWGLEHPQWAQHSFQIGDSDDDPMFGALPDEDLPVFAPARRILEWPVVPTGVHAPGTYSRHEYYLARLGPWVVHFPRPRCGRRIESDRALAMGLPWQWCRECWANEYVSRGDMENELAPELE